MNRLVMQEWVREAEGSEGGRQRGNKREGERHTKKLEASVTRERKKTHRANPLGGQSKIWQDQQPLQVIIVLLFCTGTSKRNSPIATDDISPGWVKGFVCIFAAHEGDLMDN